VTALAAFKPLIAVKNFSTVVTDAELRAALQAFQRQMSGDFAQEWGLDAVFQYLDRAEPLPPGAWQLNNYDDADQAGALGYHDLTPEGLPAGKCFAKTTKTSGGLWTVTFTHEANEMRADPNINLVVMDDANHRLLAYESNDAVEADELAYDIDGVKVSDFVLPSWFRIGSSGERHAFKSKVTEPFQLLPGGYIGFYDLAGGGWQQLTAREVVNARAMHLASCPPGPHQARPQVGSRRERRRTHRSQWLHSTAV
jgi:hypothetical protein